MKITVMFHRNDDLALENRSRIEGLILTMDEAETAEWTVDEGRMVLTYRSERHAYEVVSSWENEGYDVSEFHSFTISG